MGWSAHDAAAARGARPDRARFGRRCVRPGVWPARSASRCLPCSDGWTGMTRRGSRNLRIGPAPVGREAGTRPKSRPRSCAARSRRSRRGGTQWSTRLMAECMGAASQPGGADLERPRTRAPQGALLPTLHRSPLRREGPRCGGALRGAAGAGDRLLFRREEPDPGAGPDPAAVAAQEGMGGHHDARLPAPRDHDAVRGGERRHRRGHPSVSGPHRHQEFLHFLRTVEKQCDPELDLHFILDNYATYKHARVKGWAGPAP